jgi:hypothetical protein
MFARRQWYERFDSRLRDAVHAQNEDGVHSANKGGRKVRTPTITLSAAILIAAAPAVLAGNASSKTPHQHHLLKKHSWSVSGHAGWMHDNGVMTGYPGIPGYAPGARKDYNYENSRNAGGGGGGGSGM